MKLNRINLFLISLLLGVGALCAQDKIKVALFQGHGGSETCVWETKAALDMDRAIAADLVTTAGMTKENLKQYDVVVIPGGGGSRQYLNMGGQGREALRSFVQNGGGVLGICAGAYLLTDTPEYACLAMSGAQAHDIEHDNRGRGISKVTLNEAGKALFPELAERDTIFIMYYEGPVALQNEKRDVIFTSLATMESDVHVEGNAPANMTNNKTFLYQSNYGKGKTMSVVGHPEATPGMQWMISRLVHEVSPRKMAAQLDSKFIDPDKFNCEILMDDSRREKESSSFNIFLYGSSEEKIEQLDWLIKNNSWDAKRWIQGLIHDSDPKVRKSTAEQVGWAMYKMYLPDLITALSRETDNEVKAALERVIQKLQ